MRKSATQLEREEAEYVLTRKGAILNVLLNCGVDNPAILAEAIEQRLKRYDLEDKP